MAYRRAKRVRTMRKILRENGMPAPKGCRIFVLAFILGAVALTGAFVIIPETTDVWGRRD